MRLQSTVSGWERTSQKQRRTALKSKEKRINKETRGVEGGHRRRSISSAWWRSSVNTSCQDRKESAEGFVHHGWLLFLLSPPCLRYSACKLPPKKKYWNFQWRSNFTCSRSSVVIFKIVQEVLVSRQTQANQETTQTYLRETHPISGAQIEMNTIRPVKTMTHPFTKKYMRVKYFVERGQ